MRFQDLVVDLAAEERAEQLAALDAAAPDPMPPVVIETVEQAQDLAHEMFPAPGAAVRWLVDAVIDLLRDAGHPDPAFAARSARRWLQPGACPVSRGAVLITLVEREANRRIEQANAEAQAQHEALIAAVKDAAAAALAATRLRRLNPSGVSVGQVSVAYDDRDDGDRGIGSADIDWADTLAALDNDDLDAAEEAFSRAVLDDYDPGLGETLWVLDYERTDLI